MKKVRRVHDNFQARRLHLTHQMGGSFRGADDIGRLWLDAQTEVVFLGDFVGHLERAKEILPRFGDPFSGDAATCFPDRVCRYRE